VSGAAFAVTVLALDRKLGVMDVAEEGAHTLSVLTEDARMYSIDHGAPLELMPKPSWL
jgi:hypothetical protein